MCISFFHPLYHLGKGGERIVVSQLVILGIHSPEIQGQKTFFDCTENRFSWLSLHDNFKHTLKLRYGKKWLDQPFYL